MSRGCGACASDVQHAAEDEPLRLVGGMSPRTLDCLVHRLTSRCTCSICMDVMVVPHTLTCGHAFCAECLVKWLLRASEPSACPECCAAATLPVRAWPLEHVCNELASIVLSHEHATRARRLDDAEAATRALAAYAGARRATARRAMLEPRIESVSMVLMFTVYVVVHSIEARVVRAEPNGVGRVLDTTVEVLFRILMTILACVAGVFFANMASTALSRTRLWERGASATGGARR